MDMQSATESIILETAFALQRETFQVLRIHASIGR